MTNSAETGTTLRPNAFAVDTSEAARMLIGARLVRGSGPNARIGRIVEVEAYGGKDDLASHARFGPTARNAAMFGPPGRAYVYFVYGMYHCLNVVTEQDGQPGAVLIRSVRPIHGESEMRQARLEHLRDSHRLPSPERLAELGARLTTLPTDRLAGGPGLLCAAFSIDRTDNAIDLCDPNSDLRIETSPQDEALAVEAGPRIGIGYAPEPWRSLPWRFYASGLGGRSSAAERHQETFRQ
jgi:DNA-3-methyladenine glycosylase